MWQKVQLYFVQGQLPPLPPCFLHLCSTCIHIQRLMLFTVMMMLKSSSPHPGFVSIKGARALDYRHADLTLAVFSAALCSQLQCCKGCLLQSSSPLHMHVQEMGKDVTCQAIITNNHAEDQEKHATGETQISRASSTAWMSR